MLYLIGQITLEVIHIVAPVMYKDAERNLKKGFPNFVSRKFEFLTLIVDTIRKSSGKIVSGIGGMVYLKLGLGDIKEKNKYTTKLVLYRLNRKNNII